LKKSVTVSSLPLTTRWSGELTESREKAAHSVIAMSMRSWFTPLVWLLAPFPNMDMARM
jgi:hypothetical protein